MTWLLAAMLCCVGPELFFRLPIGRATGAMLREGMAASKVVASRKISDHWKERVMPVYARRMGWRTLVLSAWLAVLAAILGGLFFLAETIAPDISGLLSSTEGLIGALGVSFIYFAVRQRLARP